MVKFFCFSSILHLSSLVVVVDRGILWTWLRLFFDFDGGLGWIVGHLACRNEAPDVVK